MVFPLVAQEVSHQVRKALLYLLFAGTCFSFNFPLILLDIIMAMRPPHS